MARLVWTADRTLAVVRDWAADGGDMRIASYREWKRTHAGPADTVITRRFGSWREMVREAGFAPVDKPGYDGAYRR